MDQAIKSPDNTECYRKLSVVISITPWKNRIFILIFSSYYTSLYIFDVELNGESYIIKIDRKKKLILSRNSIYTSGLILTIHVTFCPFMGEKEIKKGEGERLAE